MIVRMHAALPSGLDYNARYRSGWAYGKRPSDFLAATAASGELAQGRPLRVLSLGEGQGRNAVHLATLGHECTCVDASQVGMAKARLLAEQRGVSQLVHTVVADLADFELGVERWDAIISVFCALPPPLRARLHGACVEALRPGGVVLVECFAPRQIELRGRGGCIGPDVRSPSARTPFCAAPQRVAWRRRGRWNCWLRGQPWRQSCAA